MQKRKMLLGCLYIIFSAVIFGCMPLMAKHLYADGVNSMTLVALRNTVSLPFLLLIAVLKKEPFPASARDALPVFWIGILGCAVTPLLLFSSYNYMNSGAATVLHFVYPAAVLLLEFVFLGGVKRESLIAIALCIVGIALFYNPAEGLSLAGSALALLSGLSYAGYIFLLGRIGKRGMGGFAFSFFATLAATVVMWIACFASGAVALPRTAFGWGLSVAFALVVNIGAVMLFQSGAFIIGAQKAAILSTFEPITSLIVGYFAFSEAVAPLSILGSVLVIAASAVIGMAGEGEEAHENKENAENGDLR
ncbi:MAG: DMT family transporter [Clostridia bacterium]|nr:DMT family transporter [Clostridia bacterium]